MDTCLGEFQDFISKRVPFLRALKSSYNSNTYVAPSLCLDSPTATPVFNAYTSRPGRAYPPVVTHSVNDPDNAYDIVWYPANPNGYPVGYEIYVTQSGTTTLVYKGTGTSTNWTMPDHNQPATFSFTAVAYNALGYGTNSSSTDVKAFTTRSLDALTAAAPLPVWVYIVIAVAILVVLGAVGAVVYVYVVRASPAEPYKKFGDAPDT